MKKGTVNACRGRHLHKGGREGRQKRKSNTLARGLSKSTRTWLVRLAAFAAAAAFSGDDTRPSNERTLYCVAFCCTAPASPHLVTKLNLFVYFGLLDILI